MDWLHRESRLLLCYNNLTVISYVQQAWKITIKFVCLVCNKTLFSELDQKILKYCSFCHTKISRHLVSFSLSYATLSQIIIVIILLNKLLRFVDSTVCSLFWLLFLTGPRNITTWLTPLLLSVACVAGLEIEGIRLSLPFPTLYPFFTCHADYVPWHFQTFSVKNGPSKLTDLEKRTQSPHSD